MFSRYAPCFVLWLAASNACRPEPAADAAVLSIASGKNQTPFIASRGDLVAVVWTADREGDTDVFLAMSTDGGRAFSDPRRVNDVPGDVNVYGEQPPRVALGPGTPAPVYVTWTSANRESGERRRTYLRFTRSLDGGESFEPAITLHEPELPGDRGWHSLSVSPAGEVHAIWLDSRPDGGDRMGLYHIAWDGGSAPEAERLFDGVCECCKTGMAIGADGAIHAAWRQIYGDNYRDIAFASSRDGGVSFGDPVRVNEDGWRIEGCPDDGPAMAVGPGSRVHVVWPTLVHDRMDMGIFSASTADGIEFSPRTPVPNGGGTDPSHPQLGLDGEARPFVVWDEVVEGKRRVLLTRGSPAADGTTSWSEPLLLDEGGEGVSASYPVAAAVENAVVVVWTSQKADLSVIRFERLE